MISIIVPAWRISKYLKNCLDSIENQTAFKDNNNYEILLGIDGCKKTWLTSFKLFPKYSNFRVFWFSKNQGPYIIRNTLAYKATYNYLLFFDADDVMFPDLIERHLRIKGPSLQIKHSYRDYDSSLKTKKFTGSKVSEGSFGIYAEKFKEYGGFLPLKCGADTEFNKRFCLYGGEVINIGEGFKRRIHSEGLTSNPLTGRGSKEREKALIALKQRRPKYIKPTFASYVEETNYFRYYYSGLYS